MAETEVWFWVSSFFLVGLSWVLVDTKNPFIITIIKNKSNEGPRRTPAKSGGGVGWGV